MKQLSILFLIILFSNSALSQDEPSDLTDQLRKSIEQLDIDIDEVKKKLEEQINSEEIDKLKKIVEDQVKNLKEEDIVKQYDGVKEQIESGEIEDRLKEFFPELSDPAMMDKMDEAMKQLKNFDVERIMRDGEIVLGRDTLDISTYIDPDNEILRRFKNDFQSLDENFRTVYPNIDVMLRSLEDGFKDARGLELEKILDKIQKSYSQPKNKSISI